MNKRLSKLFINREGFTFVELLIVIAIIAILAVIGIAVFTDAQKNARDAERRGDIDAMAKALESNKNPAGQYQLLANSQFTNGLLPGSGLDPSGIRYCGNIINSTNTAPNNLLPPAPTEAQATSWGAGGGCPDVIGGNGQGEYNRVGTAGTSPKLPANEWRICTYLENTTPHVYCKKNFQ